MTVEREFNSETILKLIRHYFNQEHFPVKAFVTGIIAGVDFDEEEMLPQELLDFYYKIVNQKERVIEIHNQGFIGCMLKASIKDVEIRVQIAFPENEKRREKDGNITTNC